MIGDFYEDFRRSGKTMREYLNGIEHRLVEGALAEEGGAVSRASRKLGFRHHHSLISLIERKHKDLLAKRSEVVARKQSIIKEPNDA